VAAVELAEGEKVEGGGEEPDPGGAGDGVEVDIGSGNTGKEPPFDGAEEDGGSELDFALLANAGDDFGEGEADADGGQSEEHAGEGTSDADIEELAASGNGGTEADECAKGADESGCGKEEGEAGVNGVIAAGEPVAELVGGEDEEKGEGVREAGEEDGGIAEGVEKSGEVGVEIKRREVVMEVEGQAGTEGRGGEEGESEEEQMKPEAVTPGRRG
jgi:hypothetical protein